MTDKEKAGNESNQSQMSADEIKEFLADIKNNPEQVHEPKDELDNVIRELIRIEKKHLHQVEKTSVQRRRQDVRELIESAVPKAMGLDDAS